MRQHVCRALPSTVVHLPASQPGIPPLAQPHQCPTDLLFLPPATRNAPTHQPTLTNRFLDTGGFVGQRLTQENDNHVNHWYTLLVFKTTRHRCLRTCTSIGDDRRTVPQLVKKQRDEIPPSSITPWNLLRSVTAPKAEVGQGTHVALLRTGASSAGG